MDPDKALADIRAAMRTWTATLPGSDENRQAVATALSGFAALDEWMGKGGFSPAAWVLENPPDYLPRIRAAIGAWHVAVAGESSDAEHAAGADMATLLDELAARVICEQATVPPPDAELTAARDLSVSIRQLRAFATAGNLAAEVLAAARDFAETWVHLATDELAGSYACSLTCSEAEALAGLYRALGRHDDAEKTLDSHAEGDGDGDLHWDRRGAGSAATGGRRVFVDAGQVWDRSLLDRLPGITEDAARALDAEVRRTGWVGYRHGGVVVGLIPSRIPGSLAVWKLTDVAVAETFCSTCGPLDTPGLHSQRDCSRFAG